MKYANIIINISHEAVDRPFTYIIPEAMEQNICPGTKVMVPFGAGNKETMGYVMDILDYPRVPIARLKEISSVVLTQDASEGKLIELAAFIKEQYGSTMISALKTVLPIKKTYRTKKEAIAGRESVNDKSGSVAEEGADKNSGGVAAKLDSAGTNNIEESMAGSCAMGQSVSKEKVSADIPNSVGTSRIILNEQQQSIIEDFTKDYDSGVRKTYLIHGVTGSGKTEVYIEMIKRVVAMGRQAIVLIPEIGLTYQTELRFKRYFGDRVSVMNSTLAPGERYNHCERAKRGEIDVIIGPRSALFTPFLNIGLIVIDEEHENTYKNENMPRYHAKEVAEKLAQIHGASLVLGSATPSVESYFNAKAGVYKLYNLSKRAIGEQLAHTHIVDLRKELKDGNRSIFSRKLFELMEDRLQKGEQIMLFLNRRGYAGFVSCRACGEVIKCPHCDVSLAEHKSMGKMVCHYCGYETPIPKNCPSCGSKYISSFKAGTEQIEAEVQKLFPGVKTLRMDADTTKRKGSFEKILSAFGKNEANVLIGTQMIVKGHDFPNVTLVGIIAADLSLGSGDFRASERTFQLLTQAAGRAGRANKSGEVVIQTYQPEQYGIVYAAKQDYEAFYEEEMVFRDISGYPPSREIMAVLVTDKNSDTAFLLSERLAMVAMKTSESANVIGPAKAGIGKINDTYRYVFYCKSSKKKALIEIKDNMESYLENNKTGANVIFDFNPMSPY